MVIKEIVRRRQGLVGPRWAREWALAAEALPSQNLWFGEAITVNNVLKWSEGSLRSHKGAKSLSSGGAGYKRVEPNEQ